MFRNGMLFFASFLITSIFNVLSIKIYTSFFTTAQFGMFTYLQGIYLLIAAFTTKWICQAIFKFISFYETVEEKKQFNGVIVVLFFITATTVFPCLKLLEYFSANSFITDNIIELYFVCITWIAVEILNAWIQAKSNARIFAMGEILRSILKLAFPIVLVLTIKSDVAMILVGISAANIIVLIFQLLKLKPQLSIPIVGNVKEITYVLWKYGFPITGWFLCAQLMNYSDRFILSYFFAIDQVGIYIANITLFGFAAQLVALPLINTVHPLLLKYDVSNREARLVFEKQLEKMTKFYIFFSAFSCALIVIFSNELSVLLLNKDFSIDTIIKFLVVFSSFFWSLGSYGNKPYEVSKRTTVMLVTIVCSLIIYFVSSLILIPIYAFHGAAISKFIGCLSYPIILYLNALRDNEKLAWKIDILKAFLLFSIITAICLSVSIVFPERGFLSIDYVALKAVFLCVVFSFCLLLYYPKSEIKLYVSQLFAFKLRL